MSCPQSKNSKRLHPIQMYSWYSLFSPLFYIQSTHTRVSCRSRTCTILKHVSVWHGVPGCKKCIGMSVSNWNFKLCHIKPVCWMEGPDEKITFGQTCHKESQIAYACLLLCLLLLFSEINVAMSWKDILSSVPNMTKFAQCSLRTSFRKGTFSEWHTMPVWNMSQDGMFQNGMQTHSCVRCFYYKKIEGIPGMIHRIWTCGLKTRVSIDADLLFLWKFRS